MNFITCSHESHASEILEILNEEIINSTALYDYEPRTFDSMVNWFQLKDNGNFPVIGAVNDIGELMGFAT